MLRWNNAGILLFVLHLIFHFKINGAVNDSQSPTVDGGSSAANILGSLWGVLLSSAVSESYFYPCDSAVKTVTEHHGVGEK